MQVIKNFLGSEKAVAVGLLVVAGSVLTAIGKMSIAEWQSYTKWLAGIYIVGKSVHGAAAEVAGGKAAKAELDALKSQLPSSDAAADKALTGRFEKTGDDSEGDD